MLGKPFAGWTEISVGTKIIGSASYLTDVPLDLLDAFIKYFSQSYATLGFNVEFDAEGYSFGLIEFAEDLYAVDTDTDSDIPNVTRIPPEILGLKWANSRKMLLCLAKELIKDIEQYFDLWVFWDLIETEDTSVIKKREALLESKLRIIKYLISKESEF